MNKNVEWTRLFDEKLRLIDKQLYTIVEASRIIIISHSLSLSLSFIFSPAFSPVRDPGMEKPLGYKLT